MPQGRVNPYIYDPSQQIRKDLGNSAMTVEQGFQNVIDRKKQEYDYVNKAFEEIENTKKDLNIHNYELMTKRSNDLVGELKGVIKENGKVDFAKLSEVKFKVREIADAKRNSELSTQAYGEVTKMIQANAAHMIDPIGTHAKIMARLKDPKNLFSPRNMQEIAMQDFKDGIDYVKIGQEKLMELQKRGKSVEGIFTAPDGSSVKYKGIVPFGFNLDDATKQIVPITDKDGKEINSIEMISNSMFDAEQTKGFVKQIAGPGMLLNSDPSDYLKDFVKSTLGGSISYTIDKSADENKLLKLKIKEAEQKTDPESVAIEKAKKLADLEHEIVSTQSIKRKSDLDNKTFNLAVTREKNDEEQRKTENDRKDEEAKYKKANPGGLELSNNGNRVSMKVELNSEDTNGYTSTTVIESIDNAKGGGFRLNKTDGGYIHLDTEEKIKSFTNNLTQEKREAIYRLQKSNHYKNPPKPVTGKAATTKVVPSKAEKTITNINESKSRGD